jgi:hypothetical protein
LSTAARPWRATRCLRDVLPVGRLVQAVAYDGILRTGETAHRFHNAGAVVPNLRAAGVPR